MASCSNTTASTEPEFPALFCIAEMEEFQIRLSRNSKILEQLQGLAGAEGKMATDIEIICLQITSEVRFL